MRNKATATLLAITLCAAFLSGCDSSWHREVPVSPTYEEMSETEQEESKSEKDFEEQSFDSEKAETDFSKTDKENETEEISDFEDKIGEIFVCAKVSANNETIWKTQDDMLTQKLFDLLLHKQEQGDDKSLDEADFVIQIETSNNRKSSYYVWGDLQQKNELLVADEENHSWSLTKEDSNHIRSIINGV